MDTFEVVIWEDELSDGTLAYASWCTAIIGVSGQGETEAEALADIASSMSVNIFEPWPADAPIFYGAEVAAAEQVDLLAELDAMGITQLDAPPDYGRPAGDLQQSPCGGKLGRRAGQNPGGGNRGLMPRIAGINPSALRRRLLRMGFEVDRRRRAR